MKFKYIVWLIALIVTFIVCSCSTRKKNTELLKEKETAKTSEEIKIKESLIDKTTFEEWLKESNLTITIHEVFPVDSTKPDKPKERTTTYSKGSKESAKKQSNDLTQNKTVEAKKDSTGAKSQLSKKKSTATRGVGTGKVIGITFIVCVVAAALIYILLQVKKKRALHLQGPSI